MHSSKTVSFNIFRSVTHNEEDEEESKHTGIERRAASMNYKAKAYSDEYGINFNTKNILIIQKLRKQS